MRWVSTSSGYQVSLHNGTVECRSAAGKPLKRLPKQLNDDPVVVGLRELSEWLGQHEATCGRAVERWLERSEPVPVPMLQQVWPDPAWRAALYDLVVTPPDQRDRVGFLRDIDPVRGVGVITPDGDTSWWQVTVLDLPPPAQLPDLAELREAAVDLGIRQGTTQLLQGTWRDPYRSAGPAGAVLPGPAPPGPATDVYTSRAYHHPALHPRPVVRVVPQSLGTAEDRVMAHYGFAPAGAPVPVGYGPPAVVGFPAWALIHDPDNARHALAAVGEMERLAPTARSTPGRAKAGYAALAARLGRVAPHFLPTFWEQAGRAFLAASDQRMAATCFNTARAAEQATGLPVDEDRLRDVLLEFALAGALPAGGLGEYARQVASRLPPAEAYQRVREVSVRRTAGGLPPNAGILAELRRLAKAAGRDPGAEIESLLAELLCHPALADAQPGFWKACRNQLVRLARRVPAVRGQLLALVPDLSRHGTDVTGQWVELLDATAATEGLTRPAGEVAAEALPAGGPDAWLERLAAKRSRDYLRRCVPLLDLVDRMTGQLRTAGRPLWVASDYGKSADLDLLDLLVAAGVPVADGMRLNVAGWLADDAPGRRDLRALAADQRYLPKLAAALPGALARRDPRADEETLRRLRDTPGLRSAADHWLSGVAERFEGGVPTLALAEALAPLASLWGSTGVAVAPTALARLTHLDVAAALARSLRTGLVTELGWPAYDEAVARLGSPQPGQAWPELLLHDRQRAIVVGPDGPLVDHPMHLAGTVRGDHPVECWYVDGQLLVTWWTMDGHRGYWSSRPGEVLELDSAETSPSYGNPPPTGLPLRGGGWTTGARPLRAGGTQLPVRHHVISDGVRFWRSDYDRANGKSGWREYDPVTGIDGEFSLPGSFHPDSLDSDPVVAEISLLRPAPGLAGSPLGWRDGLVGWRTVGRADGGHDGEGIDGRRVAWSSPAYQRLLGGLCLPGDERPRPVSTDHNGVLTLWEPDGRQPVVRYPAGALPPFLWWHMLRPRDESGSVALRRVTDHTAAALLGHCAASAPDRLLAEAEQATVKLLPELTDPVLRRAVADQVAAAERLRRRLAELAGLLSDLRSGTERTSASDPMPDDRILGEALAGLTGGTPDYEPSHAAPSQTFHVIAQIRGLTALLRDPDCRDWIPESRVPWLPLLRGLGAVAVRAASPVTDPTERAALAGLLQVLADSPFAEAEPGIRVVKGAVPASLTTHKGVIGRSGGRTVIVLPGRGRGMRDPDTWWGRTVVDATADGRFPPLRNVTVEDEFRVAGWARPDRIARFCALLAQCGPAPWRPEAADRLAGLTGMVVSDAAVLLAGLPGIAGQRAGALTTTQRATLGLTAAQARAARDTLARLSVGQRLRLLDAAMPDDPAALWDSGPDVARLARAWTAMFGRSWSPAPELVDGANQVLPEHSAAELLRLVADGAALTSKHALAFGVLVPWLAYRLPTGDRLRAALPAAYARARERLRDPDLALHLHRRWDDIPAGVDALRVRMGRYGKRYLLMPAKLAGPADPALEFADPDLATDLRLLLAPELAGLVAALATPTPGPEQGGQFPHNPALSVPDLVEAVAKRHDLPDDAATYYLQVLALPDPTDRHVRAWNGWSAGRRKDAQAALTDAGLVVTGKRARAGRTAFLPGGWLALKAPDPPLEAWKAPLLRMRPEPTHRYHPVLVLRPVADLFRAAWQRVEAGDGPSAGFGSSGKG